MKRGNDDSCFRVTKRLHETPIKDNDLLSLHEYRSVYVPVISIWSYYKSVVECVTPEIVTNAFRLCTSS